MSRGGVSASDSSSRMPRKQQKHRSRYVQKRAAVSASLFDSLSRLSGDLDASREMIEDMEEVGSSGGALPDPAGRPPPCRAAEDDEKEEDEHCHIPAMELGSQSFVGPPVPLGRLAISGLAVAFTSRLAMRSRFARAAVGVSVAIVACTAAEWLAARLYKWAATAVVKTQRGCGLMLSGVPSRRRTVMDDLASVALVLKNSLNVSYSERCRWELVAMSDSASITDVRAPYQRGSKMEEDALKIAEYVKIDPWFGPVHTIRAVPEIVSQTVVRLNNCSPEDASKLSLTIASRISMLNVPKTYTDECYHGSATISRAVVSQRRFQDESPISDDNWLITAGFYLAPMLSSILPWQVSPASILGGASLCGIDSQFLIDVFLAPYIEEWFKNLMSKCGISRPSLTFGLVEFCLGLHVGGDLGTVKALAPALAMHALLDGLSTATRICLHQTFNLAVHLVRCRNRLLLNPGSMVGRALATCAGSLALTAVTSMACRSGPRSPGLKNPGSDTLSCFGYRFGDRVAPWTERLPTAGVRVMTHANFNEEQPRARMMVSLGPVVFGHCPPIPDRNHYPTVLHGVLNRFCSTPPPIDRVLLFEFETFVRNEVLRLPVVPPDADMTPEHWLLDTHYPRWRQDQLMEGWDNSMRSLCLEDFELNGFMKTETYLKFANPRGINSRSDNFKVAVGPCCKHMEHIVYSHYGEFIKNVPVRQRPEYITQLMGHCPGPYYETDYTAFERHFVPELLRACEMVLYDHLLHHFPELFNVIESAMCGLNRIRYKAFTICVKGRRMSGEMVTSLGNGFTNLMLAKFVAFKSNATIVGVVEGDDGLFASNRPLREDLFAKLGFTIKIQKRETLLESSFCGLMMSEDLISLTDPFVALCNLGWSTSPQASQSARVRKELLRAKALSLLHEHPQCPMLSSVAARLIELTNGSEPRYTAGWYKWKLQGEIEESMNETMRMAKVGPSTSARDCFYRLYGVSPEAQVAFENYIMNWDGGAIAHYAIESMADEHPSSHAFREMWHDYVTTAPTL